MKAERKAVKEWLRTMDRSEYERMLRDALFYRNGTSVHSHAVHRGQVFQRNSH